MKVVINKCFGGFGLSHPAMMRYAELSGFQLYPWIGHICRKVYGDRATIENPEVMKHYSRVPLDSLPLNEDGDPVVPNEAYFSERDIERNDPNLIRVVEEMTAGHRTGASGQYAALEVVEVPDDVEWEIDEYDGLETVEEKHRTWG